MRHASTNKSTTISREQPCLAKPGITSQKHNHVNSISELSSEQVSCGRRYTSNQPYLTSMDSLGILASSLCLVHCAMMPLVIAALPCIGLQFLAGNLAHRVLALFVIVFALVAVLPGYLKHRKTHVLIAMSVGLVLVLTATFAAANVWGERSELPLITVGNLIVVAAHMMNRKLCNCNH